MSGVIKNIRPYARHANAIKQKTNRYIPANETRLKTSID